MHHRALSDWMISFWLISCDRKVCYVPMFYQQWIKERNIQSPPQCATAKVFNNVVKGGHAESSLLLRAVRSPPLWGIFHYLNTFFYLGQLKVSQWKKEVFLKWALLCSVLEHVSGCRVCIPFCIHAYHVTNQWTGCGSNTCGSFGSF